MPAISVLRTSCPTWGLYTERLWFSARCREQQLSICIMPFRLGIEAVSMSTRKLPKLIVFDLDYTLWPFWVDTHVTPPFRKTSKETIVDSYGAKINCYPEVPEILEKLYNEGSTLGVASRTSEIKGARQLLDLFGWAKYFKFQEIYPGCKVNHFESIKKNSNIDLNEMIFFDDEHRNINDLRKHGVVSVLVPNGMTKKILQEGFEEFAKQRR